MKKFCVIICLLSVGAASIFMANLSYKEPPQKVSYLRIHIRANSNSTLDQNIKYQIKDHVVEYLTPKFLNCTSKTQALTILKNNLSIIKSLADKILSQNGFSYQSQPYINNEYFPTRSYNELVLENGYYDALIIKLGQGRGDNWWCVVYPPLCFVENSQNVEYKSKFLEIINKIF